MAARRFNSGGRPFPDWKPSPSTISSTPAGVEHAQMALEQRNVVKAQQALREPLRFGRLLQAQAEACRKNDGSHRLVP